jgi:hypothetical protein
METDKIEWVAIDTLIPNPENPNDHSEEQITRLAEIIQYQGWRHPIIVSNQSGMIAAGHGRLLAAKKLNMKEVPIHRQDFLDPDQEYAFVVSDNAIATWAELRLAKINAKLADLGPKLDIKMLGLKNFALNLSDKLPDVDICGALKPEDKFILVMFTSTEEYNEVHDTLQLAENCRSLFWKELKEKLTGQEQ